MLSIVEVLTAKHFMVPMIVMRVNTDDCLCLYTHKVGDSWPVHYDEKGSGDFENAQRRQQPHSVSLPGSGEIWGFEYVRVEYEMITKFYTSGIKALYGSRLHWLSPT